ncbi:MAG TPA: 50S ribosomal protein L29 [Caldisericia bacterium]|jgi:large subunit ribosomal protein L29|nr:50S ribosomal protein L29 [Caldisericia bacterium]HXK52007.1 50S ribosomal protein L29 [Caldisericia bacterium]
MKLWQIKELSTEEMEKRIPEMRKELFEYRFKMMMQQVDEPLKIRNLRLDIRRMETILRERRDS